MNNNIKTIDHAKTMGFVNKVNELVAEHQEKTGELISGMGEVLTCIAVAADNVPGMDTVRVVVDFRGYAIEYDSTMFREEYEVLEFLDQAIEVSREMLDMQD